MNPVLADIYSTVIPSMPFIIAAYALEGACCSSTCSFHQRLKKAEKQIAVLEEAVAELKGE